MTEISVTEIDPLKHTSTSVPFLRLRAVYFPLYRQLSSSTKSKLRGNGDNSRGQKITSGQDVIKELAGRLTFQKVLGFRG